MATPHSLAWYTAQHVDVLNVLAYRDEVRDFWRGGQPSWGSEPLAALT